MRNTMYYICSVPKQVIRKMSFGLVRSQVDETACKLIISKL